MLFRVRNPHQRCLQAKVKNWNELSWSLEINLIWTFDKGFRTIKIIFKSADKLRQLYEPMTYENVHVGLWY